MDAKLDTVLNMSPGSLAANVATCPSSYPWSVGGSNACTCHLTCLSGNQCNWIRHSPPSHSYDGHFSSVPV